VFDPEQSWNEWTTGKFSRVRMSEDKVHTKDSCWFVKMIYNPRGLRGVSTAGPGVDGVLQMASESSLSRFHVRVWARDSDIWHMTHVGPE
jgi:hypothetical protein